MFSKYPSLFLLPFCIAGILLANTAGFSSGWFLIFAVLSCVCALWGLWHSRSTLAIICFSVTLFCFSGFHFALKMYDVGPYHVSHFADGETSYQIWGTVRDWPLLKANRTDLVLELDSLAAKLPFRVEGSILLSVSDTSTVLQRGDRIEFSGVIYPIRGRGTPWGFDYIRSVNLKGIFGVVYTTTLLDVRVDNRSKYAIIAQTDKLRTAIREALTETLSPVSAAVASGFLIGETRNIPTQLYTYFRDSGTLHLLAVSGSNVAVILLFITVVLWLFPLNRRSRGLILLIIVGIYTLLCYGEPSVVRASIMAALVLIAGMVERRIDLNNIIASAALLILLFDPTQLFDAGTQMSFVIAWGLVIVVPQVTEACSRYYSYWWFRWLALPVIVCIVAQLIALPILAFYYERITFSGFLSNIVIIPLVSTAVIGVLVTLIAYLIWPMLGIFVGSLLNLLLEGTIHLIHLFATDISFTVFTGKVSVWLTVASYVLIVIGAFAINSRRFRRAFVIGVVLVINLFVLVRIGANYQKVEDPTLLLLPIPGGIAGIVSQEGSTDADLIINGLRDRDYDVGERILEPALKHEGITRLRTLIVRGTEFGALDDLGRLAHRYQLDSIRVVPELVNSMKDALTETGLAESVYVAEVGSISKTQHTNGYSALWGGFHLQLDSVEVFFCGRTDHALPALSEKLGKTLLVLAAGTPIAQSASDTLTQSGADWIICAYSEHEKNQSSQQSTQTPAVTASNVIPLVEIGWIRFNLNQGEPID